jgi:hypothetical protein
MLILYTNGGDLLGADIPKSMMPIARQNPFAWNPFASHTPFLLALVGGIIRITPGNTILAWDTIGLISRNVRIMWVSPSASCTFLASTFQWLELWKQRIA